MPTRRVLRLFLPLVLTAALHADSNPPCDSGEPCVEFTSVPAYRSSDPLQGDIQNVDNFADYKVCPYIRVEGGWWTKPTFAMPCVPVDPVDGTWSANITTGGSDPSALQISAFLLPVTDTPPPRAGECRLPPELAALPNATADRTGSRRTISFGGYDWTVKDLYWGPGPNHFSDSPDNVWVDDAGQLHLRITQRDGVWYAAEIISRDVFGYGTYTFVLHSSIDQLNERVVLGAFTWDMDACATSYNELDVEFSRWGQVSDPDAQYAVQPYQACGRFRFDLPGIEDTTHQWDWEPGQISFSSFQGNDLLQAWNVTNLQCIPVPANGNARINLWLINGQPPSDGQEVEVVISDFQFLPSSE